MHHFPCRYAVRQTPTEFRSSTSILTRQQEIDLKNYVIHMSERGFRITTTTIAELAKQLKDTWTPNDSLRWARRFISRHHLSLRSPNHLNRPTASVTRETIDNYFNIMTRISSDIDFINHPELLLNMNETGWGKQEQYSRKAVFVKGTKNPFIHKSFSVDHITSAHTTSAGGDILDPFLIFKSTIPNSFHHDNIYNWPVSQSSSGFMTQALFLIWLQAVIIPYAKKIGKNFLLLLDNASCHLGVQGLQLAKNNNIEIIALPPNTTHFLQPMDQLFFVLKQAFFSLSSTLHLVTSGNTIRKANFPYVLKQAISSSWNKEIIRSAYRKTGLIPLNHHAIDQSFAPSPATDSNDTDNNEVNDPCAECGRICPCKTCLVTSNPLVRQGLIVDSRAAQVLLVPPIDKPRQNRQPGQARNLTNTLNPQPTPSHTPQPNTSDEPQPSTSHEHDEPQPSTSHPPQPSTSHTSQPIPSHAPQPFPSHPPQPSASTDVSSIEPTTSCMVDILTTSTDLPTITCKSKGRKNYTKEKGKGKGKGKKNRNMTKDASEQSTTGPKNTTVTVITCDKCNKPEGKDNDFEPIWIGCDDCNVWVHLHCLEVVEQLRVLTSIQENTKWLCSTCRNGVRQTDFQLYCDVCALTMSLDDFCVWPQTDAAKCGSLECKHVMHLSCLPEQRQMDYHNFRYFGEPLFLCATCCCKK